MNTNQWVSVDDRLPTENTEVLVITKRGRRDIMRFLTPHKANENFPIGFWYRDFGSWVKSDHLVQYWIEIPPTPKTK